LTQFEFVQVTIAIILGLGLTDILRNLGEQFRRRREIEVSWLQILASCLLLSVILVAYLWSFWTTSNVEWTLLLFVLQAGAAVSLALSAQFIKVDLSAPDSPTAQYFDNCRATYGVWAAAPVFGLLFSLSTGNLGPIEVFRIIVSALLVSMGFIKRPIYHAIVLGTLLFIVTVLAPAIGGLAMAL
jgi:hypothetical protein